MVTSLLILHKFCRKRYPLVGRVSTRVASPNANVVEIAKQNSLWQLKLSYFFDFFLNLFQYKTKFLYYVLLSCISIDKPACTLCIIHNNILICITIDDRWPCLYIGSYIDRKRAIHNIYYQRFKLI